MSIKDAVETLQEALTNFVEEIENNGGAKAVSVPEKPEVRGTLRHGKLHLQYGTVGSYKKADVELSGYEYELIQKRLNTYAAPDVTTSLSGSNTRYLRGTVQSGGPIVVGGVSVKSPFWSEQAAPRYPKY